MSKAFVLHTPDSAPGNAGAVLADSKSRLGFIPNLYAVLAESPEALDGYLQLSGIFAKTALSPAEQHVVMLAVSVENGWEFCVAAHSMIAKAIAKLPAPIVDALRSGGTLPEARLNALADFVRTVVKSRGWVDSSVLDRFLAAGFEKRQVLDVILGVAMKTLSNYANHVAHTALNPELESARWTAPRRAAA